MLDIRSLRIPALLGLCLACVAAEAQDLRFGGFLSHGYIESSRYNYLVNSEEGSFEFGEIGLNASWTPFDRTTLNGQFFAFELGRYGNYEPTIDYLFVDYNFRKEIGVRLGRVKREIGIYTHIQDIDAARASVLLPMGIYDQRYRDFSAWVDGAAVYGTVALAPKIYIDYSIYGGWVGLKKDGGSGSYAATLISRKASDPAIESVDDDINFGMQFWLGTPVPGLRFGAGTTTYFDISVVATGNVPAPPHLAFLGTLPLRLTVKDARQTFQQISAEYYISDWTFIAEVHRNYSNFYSDTSVGGMIVEAGDDSASNWGWYASAARRFGKFEGAATYTEYYPDYDQDDGSPLLGYSRDLQFSLRYDVTDFWSLKIERHAVRGSGTLFNQFGQNPVLDEKSWSIWAAKSTFSF